MPRRKSTEEEVRAVSISRSTMPRFIITTLIAGVVIIGGAVYLGKSDTGQIDVANTIRNSNQANLDAGGRVEDQVGTVNQAFQSMPNGGLVPQEGTDVPPPVQEEIPQEDASGTTTVSETTDESTPGEASQSDADTTSDSESVTE